jgi:hypothetical protein
VTYQWAVQTQTTPEVWKDLAFNLNCQVEEFYNYIYNNYNKRTDMFSFELSLDNKATVGTYHMMIEPN